MGFRAAAFYLVAAHIADIPACAAGFDRRRRRIMISALPMGGDLDDVMCGDRRTDGDVALRLRFGIGVDAC